MSTIFHSTSEMLKSILDSVKSGRTQLPDFQRGWVWDDERIRNLLTSILKSYPIGAVMLLETGGSGINFKPRLVEGLILDKEVTPQRLILDGQQRITSLFQTLYLEEPVKTRDSRGSDIKRRYYLDINIATDEYGDKDEAIVSAPEDGIIKGKGNVVLHDYSTKEKECGAGMLPIHYLFKPEKLLEWQNIYFNIERSDERSNKWSKFMADVFSAFNNYQVPVITMLNTTPKDAVCQVFEHVNTGGVTLTVFELLTASFAAEDFSLREDWEKRYNQKSNNYERSFSNDPILSKLNNTDFLQAIALLTTYDRKKKRSNAAVSCKRKDILDLTVENYKNWSNIVEEAFYQAAQFLMELKIFRRRDIPYPSQLIPLTAIFAELGNKARDKSVRDSIARWYWSGVFGELYGSATETRFAKDLPQVIHWINGGELPDTIKEANFEIDRLITLRTRNSAAYKGIYALLMKEGCHDFMSGVSIDLQTYYSESIDIHHIFPTRYCNSKNISRDLYNSIINKTPLSARTNRSIGGNAPSKYLKILEQEKNIRPEILNNMLETHLIDVEAIRSDDFEIFFQKRKQALFNIILKTMDN